MTADASKLVDFLRREAAEEYMPAQKDMYLQAAAALEAARVDAARYRWLRECDIDGEDRVMIRGEKGRHTDELLSGDALDAAIDAAMADATPTGARDE